MKFAIAGLVILIVAFVAVVAIVLRNRNQDEHEYEDFDDNQSPFADSNDTMAQSGQIARNSGMNVPQQQAQGRDTLKISQSYIEQQRYDEAESELKTGIRMQPENNTFYLKLLNLYALTNNHQEFQIIFAQIIANGDIDAIKQAEQLKSMVDAEQTSIEAQATKPEVQAEFVPDQGIDFNLGDDASTDTLNAPVDNTSELNVDEPFGNLEDSLLDGGNNDLLSTASPSASNEASLDFDLSMDSLDTSSSLQESSSLESVAEMSFDISETSDVSLDNSLSLDNDVLGTELHTTQKVAQEETADDIFDNNNGLELSDFNFDDEPLKPEQDIAEISETTTTPINTPDVNEISNNDFDFDEKTVANTNEQSLDDLAMGMTEDVSQPTSEMDLNADLLSGVGALGATAVGAATVLSDEPSIAAPTVLEESFELSSNTVASTDEGLGDLDDLSFDTVPDSSALVENTVDGMDDITDVSDMNIEIDMPTEMPTSVTSPDLQTDLDGLSDFNFDLPSDVSEASPTSTEVETVLSDDSLTQFDNLDDISTDELNFDSQDSNTEIEAVIEAPTLDAPVILDTPAIDIEQPTSATHNVDEFVSSVNASDTSIDSNVDYSADFALLESLNNNQITLDLASQYLDLGEYDSAKRLLSEVMEVGTTEQQQKAQELLEHAS